jgi:hypothetical protein
MTAQTPADVKPVSPRHHDVQQKQGRRLPLGVGNNIDRGVKQARIESRCFKVMLHQP